MQNSTQSNEDDFMELFVKSSQLNLTKTQLVQIVSEAFLSGAFSANEHQDSSNFWQNLDKDKQIFLNEDLTEFLNKCWNDGF